MTWSNTSWAYVCLFVTFFGSMLLVVLCKNEGANVISVLTGFHHNLHLQLICICTRLPVPSCLNGFIFSAHIENTKLEKKKRQLSPPPSFHRGNCLLLEMIPNVTASVYVSLYLCMRVCVPAWQGGCSYCLRLHSSVCIRSRPNEAESLAFVRRICRETEWWASHSAGVPMGSAHIWGPCPLFARWLSAPLHPCCKKVMPHTPRMPSGESTWLPLRLLILSKTGDITGQPRIYGILHQNGKFITYSLLLANTSTYNSEKNS